MESKSAFDKLFQNMSRLAKKHSVETDIIIDGKKALNLQLKKEGEILVVYANVIDLQKILTTPELVKSALSLLAHKKTGKNKLEVKIEIGFLKKLFGKK